MTHSQPSFTRAGRGLGLIVAFAALWAAWRTIQPGGDFAFLMFQDCATALAATIATLLLAFGARKGAGPMRAGWLLMAIGTGMWAVGEIGWSLYDLRGVAPFPSILDVAYLAAYVPFTIGVVLIASPNRSLARTRTALDGLALVLSTTAFVWLLVLEPTYANSESTFAAKAIGGAYPILDLVVLFAVLMAVVRFAQGSGALAIRTLFVGVGLIVVADAGFAYVSLHEWQTVGEWLSAGWVFGYLFIALAALLQMDRPIERAAQGERATVSAAWRQAGPLTMLLGFLAFWTFRSGSVTSDLPFTVMIALAALLITARQFVTLQDNVRLNGALSDAGRVLETRVQERTHQLEQALQDQMMAEEEQKRLVSVLEATPDFVATFDLAGRLLFINRSARLALGLAPDADMRSANLIDQFPAWASDVLTGIAIPSALRQGVWKGETAIKDGLGGEIPVSQVIVAHRLADGSPPFLSTVARDIRERKQFEAQLVSLASQDSLTKITNRRRFEEELRNELARSKRFRSQSALLFLDLDDFKGINDSLGHGAGDELLVGLAAVLGRQLRETDFIGRMGGDEFAILLAQTGPADALAAAERVLDAVRTFHIAVSEKPVGVTASLGIAMLPEHGATAEEAFAHADLAMYRAKTLRDRFCVFSPEKDSEQVFTLQRVWEERLRAALEGDVFSFCAQPIVALRHDEVRYELLLRIKGEDGDLVLPGEFLPIAERTGLIFEIDRWVLRRAIQLLAEQQRAGRDVVFEVNLSAKAFADDELPSLVESELETAGARAEGLVLEITETAAIANIERASRFISTLKELGCRFAIDDFGVGFSSFYYLKHLPVDYLKIDGSFVRNLARDAVDQHLVRAIVEVARGLGKETIAEFVGDAETVEILREMGVDYAQGFYLGVPRPVSEALSVPGRSFERAA